MSSRCLALDASSYVPPLAIGVPPLAISGSKAEPVCLGFRGSPSLQSSPTSEMDGGQNGSSFSNDDR